MPTSVVFERVVPPNSTSCSLAPTVRGFATWTACAAGGLIFATALDSEWLGFACWFAAAPLLYVLATRTWRRAWVAGTIFAGTLYPVLLRSFIDSGLSVYVLTVLGTLLLYGLVAGVVSTLPRGSAWPFGVAGVFVLAEWVKSRLGLEWGTLGYTQWNVRPSFALAEIVGAQGLSFLIWFVNAHIAAEIGRSGPRSALWPGRVTILLLLCLFAGYGSLPRESTDPSRRSVDVVVVPGNYSSELRDRSHSDPALKERLLSDYLTAANSTHTAPQLIVGPEMTARVYVDRDYWLRRAFEKSALPANRTVLLGGLGYSGDLDFPFNSGFALDHRGAVLGRYDKSRLVPAFEFQPFPWLWELRHPGRVFTGFSPGPEREPLRIGGMRVGVGICYEENFSHGFRLQTQQGAQLLVTLGSVSFGGGVVIARQMHVFALFRAMETGRWLVRSVNGGISEIIDDRGRVVASLAYPDRLLDVTGTRRLERLRHAVPLIETRTPFVRWGYRFSPVGAVVAVLVATLLGRHEPGAKKGGATTNFHT